MNPRPEQFQIHSHWARLILNRFSSKKIQKVFRISSEWFGNEFRKGSDLLRLNFILKFWNFIEKWRTLSNEKQSSWISNQLTSQITFLQTETFISPQFVFLNLKISWSNKFSFIIPIHFFIKYRQFKRLPKNSFIGNKFLLFKYELSYFLIS